MVEFLFWLIIGVGILSLVASIVIGEYVAPAEPPAVQDEQEHPHVV